jgi:hypothetical protein
MFNFPKTKTWQKFIGRFYFAFAYSADGWYEVLKTKCKITGDHMRVYHWCRIAEYMYPDDEATKLIVLNLFWFEIKFGWGKTRIGIDIPASNGDNGILVS